MMLGFLVMTAGWMVGYTGEEASLTRKKTEFSSRCNSEVLVELSRGLQGVQQIWACRQRRKVKQWWCLEERGGR